MHRHTECSTRQDGIAQNPTRSTHRRPPHAECQEVVSLRHSLSLGSKHGHRGVCNHNLPFVLATWRACDQRILPHPRLVSLYKGATRAFERVAIAHIAHTDLVLIHRHQQETRVRYNNFTHESLFVPHPSLRRAGEEGEAHAFIRLINQFARAIELGAARMLTTGPSVVPSEIGSCASSRSSSGDF